MAVARRQAPTGVGWRSGVAVVAVERVEVLGEQAEVELRLWCGSLCGVFLTYKAARAAGGWTITGTTGPGAVS